MAGQVRKDQLLGKAVVILGTEIVVLSILVRDQRVVKGQVSEMQNRHSSGAA